MSAVTIPALLGGSGRTYSDDGTAAYDMRNRGATKNFFPLVQDVLAMAMSAYNSANSAVNAPGTNGTSTTSLTIAKTSQTFTTQTGKAFSLGQPVVIASSASPGNAMFGIITAYNSGTGAMTVAVAMTTGSGTINAWIISLTGPIADGLKLIATANASNNATVDFIGLTGYSYYAVELLNIVAVSGSAGKLTMRSSQDNGATWYSATDTHFWAGLILDKTGATTNAYSGTGSTVISLSPSSSNSEGIDGTIKTHSLGNGGAKKFLVDTMIGKNRFVSGGNIQMPNTLDINGLRFFFDSGNIASGTFKIYGMAN